MIDQTSRRWRRVFVDSSAYFALAHRPDVFHAAATALAGGFRRDQYRFFTTNFVLAELHALLLSRVNRQIALATLTLIDTSGITTIVRVRQRDELRAREIVARFDDKDFSLVDAISFSVMERLGIAQSFTFDVNFAQYGWIVHPPNVAGCGAIAIQYKLDRLTLGDPAAYCA